jgi:hypothetical protein
MQAHQTQGDGVTPWEMYAGLQLVLCLCVHALCVQLSIPDALVTARAACEQHALVLAAVADAAYQSLMDRAVAGQAWKLLVFQ